MAKAQFDPRQKPKDNSGPRLGRAEVDTTGMDPEMIHTTTEMRGAVGAGSPPQYDPFAAVRKFFGRFAHPFTNTAPKK